MAKLAMIIRDTYVNKYEKTSTTEKDKYNKKAKKTYETCLVHFDKFATERKIEDEDRIRFLLSIEENIVIECLIANPNNPQVIIPVAQQAIGELYTIIFEKATEVTDVNNILAFIETNTNTESATTEKEEILKHLRFLSKYYAIGESDE